MNSSQIYDPRFWNKRLAGLIAAIAIIVGSIIISSIFDNSDLTSYFTSLDKGKTPNFEPMVVSSPDDINEEWYPNIEEFIRDARKYASEGKFYKALPTLDNAIYESLKNGTPDVNVLYEKRQDVTSNV